MADTTQIDNLDIVKIASTYNNTPVDAGLSGVCLIMKGQNEGLHTYYNANDVATDFGNDSYATTTANAYFSNGESPMFQVITYDDNDEDNGAVEALRKYYECGASYFTCLVTSDNVQGAIDLANLVENQGDSLMFLAVPTYESQPKDFSKFAPLQNNKSTVILSTDTDLTDLNQYPFGSEVLGIRANQAPNASLQSIHDLSQTQPQSKFDFTSDELKQYKQYGVITYAYRNGIPMLTGNNSPAGYQVSNIITRNYLNYNIKKNVTNLIINNDISYNDVGINAITDQIRLILNDAQNRNYIDSFNINQPNASQISAAKKESGELDGLSYSWVPTNNITNVVFQQSIQLPQLS